MSLHLTPPEKPLSVLKALAASGSSGLAKKSQAELQRRQTAKLASEIGREVGK